MKKFLKFIVWPLLVLSVIVALFGAGWWWGATHTQAFAGMARGGGDGEFRRPAFDTGRQPFQPRPEGFEGRERGRGPSLLRGLGGVFGSLIKLSVIVVLVLLAQRGLAWFENWRAKRKTSQNPPTSGSSAPQSE